jgi:acetylornithine deacetylase
MPDAPVLSLLDALVAIPSVNPGLEADGAGEAEVARWCARRLGAWGFDVEVSDAAPGRPNVVARHGRGDPVVLLNGHTDTVGVAGMRVAPFTPQRRDGRLHGRGACDMKGGVAALLEAARRVAAEPHPGTIVVALTCDEEHASLGMAALVEGGLHADAAVVCEPTGLALMPAHKGFAWLEVSVRGRAAHGSRPDEGIDAVRRAAAVVGELDVLERRLASAPAHPLLGHGSVHVGTIAGGSAPSVYPEHCTVVVERRTLPGEGEARVLAEMESLVERVRARIPGLDAAVRVSLFRPGTEVPDDHPLVRTLQGVLAARGHPTTLEPMTAWVDAAFLNEAGIPAVCLGPGSIARAHTADEYVEMDEVVECTEILVAFLRQALAGPPGAVGPAPAPRGAR